MNRNILLISVFLWVFSSLSFSFLFVFVFLFFLILKMFYFSNIFLKMNLKFSTWPIGAIAGQIFIRWPRGAIVMRAHL